MLAHLVTKTDEDEYAHQAVDIAANFEIGLSLYTSPQHMQSVTENTSLRERSR